MHISKIFQHLLIFLLLACHKIVIDCQLNISFVSSQMIAYDNDTVATHVLQLKCRHEFCFMDIENNHVQIPFNAVAGCLKTIDLR